MALPQELLDYILDFCYNDKKTLSSCSLVNKAFSPSSSFHLLERVKFDQNTIFEVLNHSRVVAHTRCVLLTLDESDDADSAMELLEATFGILALLQLAVSLIVDIPLQSWEALPKTFNDGHKLPSMDRFKHLHFDGREFQTLEPIFVFLQYFPSLTKLSFEAARWLDDTVPEDAVSQWPMGVGDLSLTNSFPVELLNAIMSFPNLPRMHTLTLTLLFDDELECVGKLLRLIGHHLVSLKLTLGRSTTVYQDCPVDLSHNTSLIHLSLDTGGDAVLANAQNASPAGHLVLFLSQPRAVSIQTLCLTERSSQDPFNPELAPAIARILETPPYANLRLLRFLTELGTEESGFLKTRDTFKAFKDRGMLRFQ